MNNQNEIEKLSKSNNKRLSPNSQKFLFECEINYIIIYVSYLTYMNFRIYPDKYKELKFCGIIKRCNLARFLMAKKYISFINVLHLHFSQIRTWNR